MPPNYSPFTAATDGPLKGPRWLLWLVKVATGALVSLPVFYLAGGPWAAAVLFGYFAASKSVYVRWRGMRPWSFAWNGITASPADIAFDLMLHLLPLLVLVAVPWPIWAIWTAIVLATYPYARP
jgi:hypothetical protein